MPHDERKDLFPGALELMILQILRHGPLHGYAIAQLIKLRSRDVLSVEEGSLVSGASTTAEGWIPGGQVGNLRQ